jgi:hypothetical protein
MIISNLALSLGFGEGVVAWKLHAKVLATHDHGLVSACSEQYK